MGTAAGLLVGVIEAAIAAGAGHGLAGRDFWQAWALTVVIYATPGAAALGGLGLVVGLLMSPFGRPAPGAVRALYCAIAAVIAPVAVVVGHTDFALEPAAVAGWRLLPVGVSYAAVGIAAWASARLLRLRIRFDGADAAALVAGALVGGAIWAARAEGGLTPVESTVAITGGAGVALGLLVAGGRWRDRVIAQRVRVGVAVALPVIGGVALGLTLPGALFPAARPSSPNVLVVTIDALRADRLGAYGSRRGLTPHLDRFSHEAVVFENAFAPSPWTAASMAAMLTSLYPSELGLVAYDRSGWMTRFHGGVLTEQPTLAEVLRRAGYVTAAELTNSNLRRDQGFARGFLRFRNPYDYAGEQARVLPRCGKFQAWFPHTSLARLLGEEAGASARYYRAPGVALDDAERVMRDAASWLAEREGGPFFLWLHLMDPHGPYDPPDAPRHLAADASRPPAKLFADLAFGRPTATEEEKRLVEALYDLEVRYADRWVGWLLERLRRQGLHDDTLVIVTADHGEEFWDHGSFEHGHSLYDEVIRIPLLVKFPGGRHAGMRVPHQASLLDLPPTVLEVARLPVPDGMRGVSLLRLMRGDPPGLRQLFFESALYGEELKGLRTLRYKIILREDSGSWQVYDLQADPGERDNLAGDPTVAPPLRERLLAWAHESAEHAAEWAHRIRAAPPLDPRTAAHLRSLGYLAE